MPLANHHKALIIGLAVVFLVLITIYAAWYYSPLNLTGPNGALTAASNAVSNVEKGAVQSGIIPGVTTSNGTTYASSGGGAVVTSHVTNLTQAQWNAAFPGEPYPG